MTIPWSSHVLIFLSLPSNNLPLREVRVRTQVRNPGADIESRNLKEGAMQRLWRAVAYRLAPLDLLCTLSYTIQDHLPGGCTAHSELDPLTSIYNI